jgi:threonine dehydratase
MASGYPRGVNEVAETSLSMQRVASSAEQAAERIAELVRETPLERSRFFSEKFSAEVYLKFENQQRTGSFKLRGASNRLMTLSPEQRAKGCVAASSGNHGAAVAYAMRALDTNGVIFVPEQTSKAKVEAIRSYGGEVRFFGSDGLDTEQHAREFADSNGMFYLSPYNDAEVIAGQGSCGIEIANQLNDADVVFVAVGGGGLISGVGSVLKTKNPDIRLVGCQPDASAVMAKSIQAGRILDIPSDPTLSDGTAGGIEAGSLTFDLCRQLVDEFVLVSEAEIAQAMREFSAEQLSEIEGAAGVAIAAMNHCRRSIAGKKVVVVVCGGNISQETLDASRGL